MNKTLKYVLLGISISAIAAAAISFATIGTVNFTKPFINPGENEEEDYGDVNTLKSSIHEIEGAESPSIKAFDFVDRLGFVEIENNYFGIPYYVELTFPSDVGDVQLRNRTASLGEFDPINYVCDYEPTIVGTEFEHPESQPYVQYGRDEEGYYLSFSNNGLTYSKYYSPDQSLKFGCKFQKLSDFNYFLTGVTNHLGFGSIKITNRTNPDYYFDSEEDGFFDYSELKNHLFKIDLSTSLYAYIIHGKFELLLEKDDEFTTSRNLYEIYMSGDTRENFHPELSNAVYCDFSEGDYFESIYECYPYMNINMMKSFSFEEYDNIYIYFENIDFVMCECAITYEEDIVYIPEDAWIMNSLDNPGESETIPFLIPCEYVVEE